jgi:gamma-glutamyltranspeptidase/glutathione hydrolase
MVTTVDGLATGAGIAMLRAGGTAVDAALAANAVLAVTAQPMCGAGGDLFALVHEPGRAPRALDASGRAGAGADLERLQADGNAQMPAHGDIRSVTVPGCVDGWCELHGRYGALSLGDVLAPAIGYARDGFPASSLLADSARALGPVPHRDDFAGDLRAGDLVRRPGLGRALEAIAREGRTGWYEGDFGRALVEVSRGEFTPDDMRERHARWVEPLTVRAWEHDIWTTPPPSQGYLTLAAAWIAQQLPLPSDPDAPRWAHLLVEAIKQAGHDRAAVLHELADGDALVAPERLAPRRAAIEERRAAQLDMAVASGDTIHLAVADRDGLWVSLTQSNCGDFGAHIAVPGTGVFLHNRGTGFSTVAGHPAAYGPGRRPPHTLCPTLVTGPDGGPRFTVGTMGADAQPMIQLQILARLLHAGQDPATAVAAGRWVLGGPSDEPFAVWRDPARIRVKVEGHAPDAWNVDLEARGHTVEPIEPFAYIAGHAHVLACDGETLAGAADPRAPGALAAGL